MINVKLEAGEIEVAQIIGKARTRANREKGIFNRLRVNSDPIQVEIDGLGAELAYCKAFNLWPDLTVSVRSGGADAVHANRSVDIKHTAWVKGWLLVTPDKVEKGTDIYALVTGTLPNYTVVGYATAGEIFRDDNKVDLGHGMSYGIPQERLHDYSNFKVCN